MKKRNKQPSDDAARYYARLKADWGAPFILTAVTAPALLADIRERMFQLAYSWGSDGKGGIKPDRSFQAWEIEVYHYHVLPDDPTIEMHVISDSWAEVLTADDILEKMDLSEDGEGSDE